MAKATDFLYLFTKPFVIDDTFANRADYILTTLNDDDRKDETLLRGLVMEFAVREKIMTVQNNEFFLSDQKQMGSWIWNLTWGNMRSLIDVVTYEKFLQSFQGSFDEPITAFLDFYVQVGSLLDPILLNTLTHRVMSTIQLIPYKANDHPEGVLSWEDIHRNTPFLWLMIYLQVVIRSQGKVPV